MDNEDKKKYLQMLGQALQKKQVTGEVLVADGVVMLLDVGKPGEINIDAYMAHLRGDGPAIERHRDINAYFGGHGTAIREAVVDIAKREGLADNWLSETVKELFYTQQSQEKWVEYPGLHVYLAPVEYVLAINVATASCSQDTEDIKILIKKLHISNAQDVFAVVTKYVPEQLLTPEMRLLVEQSFAP